GPRRPSAIAEYATRYGPRAHTLARPGSVRTSIHVWAKADGAMLAPSRGRFREEASNQRMATAASIGLKPISINDWVSSPAARPKPELTTCAYALFIASCLRRIAYGMRRTRPSNCCTSLLLLTSATEQKT